METVWKFKLGRIGENQKVTLDMPKRADILHVGAQYHGSCNDDAHEVACLWALVDDTRPTEPRTFICVMTGEPVKPPAAQRRYVGTVHMARGGFVLHIFEVIKP